LAKRTRLSQVAHLTGRIEKKAVASSTFARLKEGSTESKRSIDKKGIPSKRRAAHQ